MITQKYNLNMIPDTVPVSVGVSQYDKTSRTIVFSIYNGDVLFSIPSGSTAFVRGTKLDKTGFEYPCTINGSDISFNIEEQMTVLAGRFPVELRIINSGEILGTANFMLNVEASPLSDDTIISDTDMPLIQEASAAADRAEAAATQASNILSSVAKAQTITSGTLLDALVNNGDSSDFLKIGSFECSDFPDGYKTREAGISIIRQKSTSWSVTRGVVELTVYGAENITFKRIIYQNQWATDWQMYRGKLNTFAKKIFTTTAGTTAPYPWSVDAKVDGYTVANFVVYTGFSSSRMTNAEDISANDVIWGYSSEAGTTVRVMVFYVATDYINIL